MKKYTLWVFGVFTIVAFIFIYSDFTREHSPQELVSIMQSDKSFWVRKAACRNLSIYVKQLPLTEGGAYVRAIAHEMYDDNPYMRKNAAQSLVDIANRAPDVELILLDKIRTMDADTSACAIDAIMQSFGVRQSHEEAIRSVLSSPKGKVAWNSALNYLSKVKRLQPETIAVLLNRFEEFGTHHSTLAAMILVEQVPCSERFIRSLTLHAGTASGYYRYIVQKVCERGLTTACAARYKEILSVLEGARH